MIKISKSKKIQSRTWGLILPCEWANCMAIVYKAKTLAKHFYWVRHDRDFYGDAPEDLEGGSSHAPGELKKPHVHLLFTFNSSRDFSTVRNYFSDFPELKENSFEKIANAYGAKRYLIHADNPEKAQYDVWEVETNDKMFSNVFVEKVSNPELIRLLLSGLEQSGVQTFGEFFSSFSSFVSQMSSPYQIGMFTLNLMKEWRIRISILADVRDKGFRKS